jgi:hypothetical protein
MLSIYGPASPIYGSQQSFIDGDDIDFELRHSLMHHAVYSTAYHGTCEFAEQNALQRML